MPTSMAQIAQNEYGTYSVPERLQHRPAVRLVTAGQVYEPETIAFMARHAGDGDVIHAGTFFGDFLPGVAAGLAPGRTIWAFEPNPNSFENAARTIDLNRLDNVVLTNAALSKLDGSILFRTHDDRGEPLGGHSHFVEEDGPGIERVDSVTLDSCVPADRKVSILQLDVEGHERAALLGARRIIETWKPILILEEFRRPRWLRVNFPGLGYRQVGKLHGNRVFAVRDMDVRARS